MKQIAIFLILLTIMLGGCKTLETVPVQLVKDLRDTGHEDALLGTQYYTSKPFKLSRKKITSAESDEKGRLHVKYSDTTYFDWNHECVLQGFSGESMIIELEDGKTALFGPGQHHNGFFLKTKSDKSVMYDNSKYQLTMIGVDEPWLLANLKKLNNWLPAEGVKVKSPKKKRKSEQTPSPKGLNYSDPTEAERPH